MRTYDFDTGVEINTQGVGVDSRLRTSQKLINSTDDVTCAYQFTHAAGYEWGVGIANAVFHLPGKTGCTTFPWCTFTGPELSSIGMNEKMAKNAGVPCSTWIEKFKDNDRTLAEGESEGFKKCLSKKLFL